VGREVSSEKDTIIIQSWLKRKVAKNPSIFKKKNVCRNGRVQKWHSKAFYLSQEEKEVLSSRFRNVTDSSILTYKEPFDPELLVVVGNLLDIHRLRINHKKRYNCDGGGGTPIGGFKKTDEYHTKPVRQHLTGTINLYTNNAFYNANRWKTTKNKSQANTLRMKRWKSRTQDHFISNRKVRLFGE